MEGKEGIKKNFKGIKLKVLGPNDTIVTFSLKLNTPMKKLMSAYCNKFNFALESMRFMFDGIRIADTDTPSTLEMEDEDVVEVFVLQSGGYGHLLNRNGSMYPRHCHLRQSRVIFHLDCCSRRYFGIH